MILAFIFSYCNVFLQLSFSFALMQKKQKIKAARILLKSVSVELKGVKLAALKQHPLLNVHTPRFLNAKFMRPVLLGTRLRHRSLALLLGKATVIEFRLD